jgi:hypothetical protein
VSWNLKACTFQANAYPTDLFSKDQSAKRYSGERACERYLEMYICPKVTEASTTVWAKYDPGWYGRDFKTDNGKYGDTKCIQGLPVSDACQTACFGAERISNLGEGWGNIL